MPPRAKQEAPAGHLFFHTRDQLRQFGLRARKGLGQHFLVDEEVLRDTLAAAELSTSDLVIEVGSGLGVLTRELAARAGWVIAIELDNKLAGVLRQSLGASKNFSIVNRDVLEVDPAELLEELGPKLPPEIDPLRYKVVANLPYYITSPVLRHFLEASAPPAMMLVMVQKEVAEAIAAPAGRMSLLSVSVQFYGRPEIVRYVPAASFYPVPEVGSALLKVTVYPRPAVEVSDRQGFFDLVRAGFTTPRKQIINSVARGLALEKPAALSLLQAAGISSKRRAETLTLEEWAELWRVYSRQRAESVSADSTRAR